MPGLRNRVAGLGILLLVGGAALAAPAERYLHVKVDGSRTGEESVRVNVPLSLAEKVLPAINHERLQGGKIRLDQGEIENVDVRKVLEAVRDTRDGEFVTVDKGDDNIRVAKSKGFLLVKVREGNGSRSRVDVKVPMTVVDALLSGEQGTLDVGAALRALGQHGDEVLITVDDEHSSVRVWIDSKNEAE